MSRPNATSSADQRYAAAQFNLGINYDNGIGVEKNSTEAFKCFKLAADKGHAEARSNTGSCYGRGDGVEKNLKEAFKYFKLAADQGVAEAQNNLGICYEDGLGVAENLEEAFKYFTLAADQECAEAQCSLADILFRNKENFSQGILYYSRAANGDPKFLPNLEERQEVQDAIPIPVATRISSSSGGGPIVACYYAPNEYEVRVIESDKNTPLTRSEIIEVITALEKTAARKNDKDDSLIGDLVGISKSVLDLTDLAAIRKKHIQANGSKKSLDQITSAMGRITNSLGDDASATPLSQPDPSSAFSLSGSSRTR